MSRSTELEIVIGLHKFELHLPNGVLWTPLCMSDGSQRNLVGEEVLSLFDDYAIDLVRSMGARTYSYLFESILYETRLFPKDEWDTQLKLLIKAFN